MRFRGCSRVVPRPCTVITQVSRCPGHEPGGQRAEFAGDVDVGVVEAERADRVADVHLRGEPDLVAGLQGAVGDPLQAAYDGVGGVRAPRRGRGRRRRGSRRPRGRRCRGAGRRGRG